MYITNAIILKLDVMKLKHLLFLMLLGGILNAQEPYRSLIISESRTSAQPDNYIELTNMGDEAINLQEFKFGAIRPWAPPILMYLMIHGCRKVTGSLCCLMLFLNRENHG
jgi:hypothetical protein